MPGQEQKIGVYHLRGAIRPGQVPVIRMVDCPVKEGCSAGRGQPLIGEHHAPVDRPHNREHLRAFLCVSSSAPVPDISRCCGTSRQNPISYVLSNAINQPPSLEPFDARPKQGR
jgi:hypothetical protein